ncbi:MAG: hypothetical protein ACRDI2_06325, partial [Chloroflexota bacterium]
MGLVRRQFARRWLAPACLLGLPLLVYGRFIVLGDELSNADVFLAYRPAHAWLAEGLRQGELRLWNPFILGGFPLAFSEYGWFSPLNWLPLALLGGHAGYYAAVALYVGLAAVATYGLARAGGASRPAAALAGIVFGQSLYVVGGAPLVNQGAAYWALPALLWGVHAHFGGARWAAPALTAALALTLLGSHPQLAIIATAPAVAYTLWLTVRTRRPWRLAALGLAGALGAAVSAVRFLPTIPLVVASERSGGLTFSASALGSVSPLALLSGLSFPSLEIPRFLDPQWSAYLGPLPFLLAGVGTWHAWRRGPHPSDPHPGPLPLGEGIGLSLPGCFLTG